MNLTLRLGAVDVAARERRGGFVTVSFPRRASRSFPFISKTMNCNFISLASDLLTLDNNGNTLLHHCAGPVTLCQKIVHAQWESAATN